MIYVRLAFLLKNHWKEFLYIIMGLFALLIIIPLFSSSSLVPNADEKDIQRYVDVANNLGLDWHDLVIFDMVRYDHDLMGRDPNDAAYYFLEVHYEEFTPEYDECVETKKEKNKETGVIEERCVKTKHHREKVTLSKYIRGKTIKRFFSQQGLTSKDIYTNMEGINQQEGKRISSSSLSKDEAMKLANFSESDIEHFNAIKDSGILDELFPQFNQWGNSGAVCNVTGKLDEQKFNAVVSRMGVASNKGEVIKQIAKDEGIDPVLMVAIIALETGWGTSPAIVEHNNPAGLMDGKLIINYSTLDDGLKAQGRTLHHLIIDRGLTTIEKLKTAYAPDGAANDPNNLNKNWAPGVSSIVKQAGGLIMNCTADDNISIGVGPDGKMSYFDTVINIMLKFKGQPYSWGGASPSQGFDCSGLMQWSFGQIGIKLPRTAAEQYNATKRISASEAMAGDLVFFRGTYGSPSHVSHVGIYVGNGMMFNSNDSGIEYSNITKGYWAQHSPEFGRIK